jgi:hypothetical protein
MRKVLILAMFLAGCSGVKVVTVTKPEVVYVDMPKAAAPMEVYETTVEGSRMEVVEVEASSPPPKVRVTARVETYSCPPCPSCPACPPCPAAPACPAQIACPPPPENKQNPWMMLASAASGAISVVAAAYAKRLFKGD